jgi:hypothetical protein
MEALSRAGFPTVGNLNGIDSHNSEGNEVKWRGMLTGSPLLWDAAKYPPSVLSSYKRLGYWALLANILPTAHTCHVGRISSLDWHLKL